MNVKEMVHNVPTVPIEWIRDDLNCRQRRYSFATDATTEEGLPPFHLPPCCSKWTWTKTALLSVPPSTGSSLQSSFFFDACSSLARSCAAPRRKTETSEEQASKKDLLQTELPVDRERRTLVDVELCE